MSNNVDISIIMNDGSFREHLHGVKSFNQQDFPRDRYEIIYVDYYNSPHPELKDHNVQVICLNGDEPLKNAKAYNAGILTAKGKLIIIPDADCVVPEDFVSDVWKYHSEGSIPSYNKKIFLGNDDVGPWARVAMYGLRFNQSKLPPNKSPDMYSIAKLKTNCRPTNWTNLGACLSIQRKFLMEIGGYDEMEEQWTEIHCLHRDLWTRLRNHKIKPVWNNDLKLYHPWHPNTNNRPTKGQMNLANRRSGIESTQLQRGEWPYEIRRN